MFLIICMHRFDHIKNSLIIHQLGLAYPFFQDQNRKYDMYVSCPVPRGSIRDTNTFRIICVDAIFDIKSLYFNKITAYQQTL